MAANKSILNIKIHSQRFKIAYKKSSYRCYCNDKLNKSISYSTAGEKLATWMSFE